MHQAIHEKSMKNKIKLSKPNIDYITKPFTKILNKVKKINKPKVYKVPEDDWSHIEAHICSIIAWTGAIVITAVILRSLYLMYIKPEGT